MPKVKARVDGVNTKKVAKKKTKSDNSKDNAPSVYRYIELEDDKIFLKEDTIKELDEFGEKISDIDRDIMLLTSNKESYDLKIENMRLQIKLIEREKRDVETAIFHKKTESKQVGMLRKEFQQKIGKELGGKSKFGYHPETREVLTE